MKVEKVWKDKSQTDICNTTERLVFEIYKEVLQIAKTA